MVVKVVLIVLVVVAMRVPCRCPLAVLAPLVLAVDQSPFWRVPRPAPMLSVLEAMCPSARAARSVALAAT